MNRTVIALGSVGLAFSVLYAAGGKVQSAKIVAQDGQGNFFGDVQVTYADGSTELLTHRGKELTVHVARTRSSWMGPRHSRGPKVVIRLPDGKTKEFLPDPAPNIEDWGFADNDTAVVIKPRGRHGPAFCIKCAIATGKVTGKTGAMGTQRCRTGLSHSLMTNGD